MMLSAQEVFSQFTITLKTKEKINFNGLVMWSDATSSRYNSRYFYYRQNGKTDSLPTRLIASVTTNGTNKKINIMLGQLSMDCDKHKVGHFVTRNMVEDSFQLTISHVKGIKRFRRQPLIYPKMNEVDLNFPAGEYPYILTYKRDGRLYKQGTLKVECCKVNVLTIE